VAALTELRPGLWRWTARHPAAVDDPAPESPDDWPPNVGCVACAADGDLVFVDPLAPGGAAEQPFWDEVDALVAAHGPRVNVVTTVQWHRRSRDALAARYDATTLRARAALPAGVRTVRVRRAGEVMVWLEEHRALVSGDRLIGDGRGGIRMCPPSWHSRRPTGCARRCARRSTCRSRWCSSATASRSCAAAGGSSPGRSRPDSTTGGAYRLTDDLKFRAAGPSTRAWRPSA
jgi:hypothetical protein